LHMHERTSTVILVRSVLNSFASSLLQRVALVAFVAFSFLKLTASIDEI